MAPATAESVFSHSYHLIPSMVDVIAVRVIIRMGSIALIVANTIDTALRPDGAVKVPANTKKRLPKKELMGLNSMAFVPKKPTRSLVR